MPLHRERIKGRLSLQPFLSEAIDRTGVGDSLLLPLFSFLGIDVNGSKGLSPTPSVGNLSLRPCRYLSTVTRSSNQGSVDDLKRERLQM